MKSLSVIFVGTGPFGVQILNTLIRNQNFTISFVITSPDVPQGRRLKVHPSAIKETALKNNLIVHEPKRIIDMYEKIVQQKCDFLLVVSYGAIIPEVILKIPRLAPVNIHPSLLPKYRGASPIQESLLNRDRITGVTWISMNSDLDAGDIIGQRELPIDPDDDARTMGEKLSAAAAPGHWEKNCQRRRQYGRLKCCLVLPRTRKKRLKTARPRPIAQKSAKKMEESILRRSRRNAFLQK
ncbi:methionyl-tRNA formyltransferase [Candidatus Peregrinibacteria bacterium]|nr:methionyl-tRNA formyltransferase [Candidatus Peregrinibacteria bacterium]